MRVEHETDCKAADYGRGHRTHTVRVVFMVGLVAFTGLEDIEYLSKEMHGERHRP